MQITNSSSMQVNYHQPFLNVWEWNFKFASNVWTKYFPNGAKMVIYHGTGTKKSPSTNPKNHQPLREFSRTKFRSSKKPLRSPTSAFYRGGGFNAGYHGTPPNDTQKEIRHHWGVINHILTTKCRDGSTLWFGKVEMNSVRGWACPLVMVRNDKGPN